MNEKKVIYYTDSLNDDFADNSIKAKPIGADYSYAPQSPLWRFSAGLLYFGVAAPLVWLADKVWLGVRIRNKKVLKKAGKGGYFLYGNHTQFLDAFTPPLVGFPKKAYTIANPDASSIPGIGWLTKMLGVIPIPNDRRGMPAFLAAVEQRWREGKVIGIFPEAHIWPYYNGIRPFKATSFRYPARLGSPVFAAVAVYRKRFLCKRPAMTIYVEGPFYPDPALPERQAAEQLRDQVYARMCRVVEEQQSLEYIRYVQKPKGEIE